LINIGHDLSSVTATTNDDHDSKLQISNSLILLDPPLLLLGAEVDEPAPLPGPKPVELGPTTSEALNNAVEVVIAIESDGGTLVSTTTSSVTDPITSTDSQLAVTVVDAKVITIIEGISVPLLVSK